jgi:pimeloyl-ACP methyl ester carboxylesterase
MVAHTANNTLTGGDPGGRNGLIKWFERISSRKKILDLNELGDEIITDDPSNTLRSDRRGQIRRTNTAPAKQQSNNVINKCKTNTRERGKAIRGKVKRQVTHFSLSSVPEQHSAATETRNGESHQSNEEEGSGGGGNVGKLNQSSLDSYRASRAGQDKTHLCVLVHGLGGGPWDWTPIVLEFEKNLKKALSLSLSRSKRTSKGEKNHHGIHVHVSRANSFVKTFDGIDVCGDRLAEEIKQVVRERPSLRSISIVGHSLGGLIARYALGTLYCEETGTMYGLRPRHFATIVSPHLGCDGTASSENQVPFLEYLNGIPFVGAGIRHITSAAAAPGAALLYRKTGRQLFLKDTESSASGLPIVFQMAVNGLSEEVIDYHYSNNPASGNTGPTREREKLIPFGKALAAFTSRTLYSNVQGDHMVSWPNASIRKISELPLHLLRKDKHGIVGESDAKSKSEIQDNSNSNKKSKVSSKQMHIDMSSQKKLQDIMIESLQKVSWKRVDVKLEMGVNKLPHNYIQARPADEQSLSVTRHLMSILVKEKE